MKADLLTVKELCVDFKTQKGLVRAVDHISFSIKEGETLGIVGESGCGKSVTSLAILGLIPRPPGFISHGNIQFNGSELVGLSESEYRKIRGSQISMIFQEPMTALNPVFRVGNQMRDVFLTHKKLNESEIRKQSIEILASVGIPSPEKRIDEYPHQLSGGMRQRVMIAMALICRPKLLIADEPTTALDVTTQAQVMEEIKKLQNAYQMALILVTHDLGVIAETCERVVVMYCGKIVEIATTKDLFKNPKHPYTKGLLESIPLIRKNKIEKLPVIKGMVPDLLNLPQGCRFEARCPKAQVRCQSAHPDFITHGEHSKVACYDPN